MIFAPVWSPILTFSFYAGRAEKTDTFLNPALVFTSYSLISLLNGPLSALTVTLPVVAGGMAAFQRIQNFLAGPRQVNKRNLMTDGSAAPLEKQEADGLSDPTVIKEKGTASQGSDSGSASGSGTSPTPSLHIHHNTLDSSCIAAISGSFRYAPADPSTPPVLDITSFAVPRHRSTLVVGPVGCGKSTLLKALLGELSAWEGTIKTSYAGLAYCDQTPWIPNDSARNVILGGSDFDEYWYRRVTYATALETDFATWPDGDRTGTGSKGVGISGGQKARLVSDLVS